MKWWRDLDPNMRRLLLIGLPIVAIAALVSLMRRPAPAADDDQPQGPRPSVVMAPPVGMASVANTDAIGVGQLASFQDAITGQINAWSTELLRLQDRVAAVADRQNEQPPAGQPPVAEEPAPQPAQVTSSAELTVRHEFARAGVSLSDYGKDRAAPAGETPDLRVKRIAGDLDAGRTTIAALRASLDWIKNSYR